MPRLDSNNHSFYKITYHLILVTKFRRALFDRKTSNYAKQIFMRIGENYDVTLISWYFEQDYVHIKFDATPRTDISKFINAYKSTSSRLLKSDYPELVHEMWNDIFWTKSFCLLTSEHATRENVRWYVEKQGGNNK